MWCVTMGRVLKVGYMCFSRHHIGYKMAKQGEQLQQQIEKDGELEN